MTGDVVTVLYVESVLMHEAHVLASPEKTVCGRPIRYFGLPKAVTGEPLCPNCEAAL